MDEYEIARRASKLPDQFANRLDPEKIEDLRAMDMGGEHGELTIELAATLAVHGTPVSAAERDELQTLLDAMGMPTDPIQHLSVRLDLPLNREGESITRDSSLQRGDADRSDFGLNWKRG